MAKSKNTNLNFGAQGQKSGKIGKSSIGRIDQLQKPITNGEGLPKQDKQFSTLGKPTNFEASKTDIRYNGGTDLTSQADGFPRQDRGFSTLGKLNKQGTYTNTKFNQAVAGKSEELSAQFIGNQQLGYTNGFGPGTIDVPQAMLEPTFYILTETGDVINGYACSSGLPCSSGCEDIQQRLLWPV